MEERLRFTMAWAAALAAVEQKQKWATWMEDEQSGWYMQMAGTDDEQDRVNGEAITAWVSDHFET